MEVRSKLRYHVEGEAPASVFDALQNRQASDTESWLELLSNLPKGCDGVAFSSRQKMSRFVMRTTRILRKAPVKALQPNC
jgi:hypothetical protein